MLSLRKFPGFFLQIFFCWGPRSRGDAGTRRTRRRIVGSVRQQEPHGQNVCVVDNGSSTTHQGIPSGRVDGDVAQGGDTVEEALERCAGLKRENGFVRGTAVVLELEGRCPRGGWDLDV